jgi:3-keto-5-aminohexanoate cleavage enzyme
MEKLIITAALTGNVPTKDKNPNLPVTPREIAEDAHRCFNAGATVFHIHARDSEGKPTLDRNMYADIAEQVRAAVPEAIIQLSTGARAGREWEDRAAPVRLLSDMASFTTGSNNMPDRVYENSPQFIEFLANVFKETGVKPEIEVFDSAMVNNALYLRNKGLLADPLHFNFVMGVPGSQPGLVRNLVFLADSIPAGSTWTVSGIGRSQIPMAVAAIVMGGHVRVGLEDSMYLPDGSLASNLRLVEKVVAIAREIGREIADASEARKLLTL